MLTTRPLKLGWVILFLVLVLLMIAVLSFQHMNMLHSLAATMVEYAKAAGQVASNGSGGPGLP